MIRQRLTLAAMVVILLACIASSVHAVPKARLRKFAAAPQDSSNVLSSAKKQDPVKPGPPQTCPIPSNSVNAPRDNIFREFEVHEMRGVKNWLFQQKDFNLTEYESATLADNYIFKMEQRLPKKSEALAYLDQKGRKPQRFAEVTINFGTVPEVRQYLVGPLPTGKSTKATLLRTLPFNARFLDGKEYELLYQSVADTMGAAMANSGLSQDLLGGVYLNEDSDTVDWIDTAPNSFDGTFRRTWFYWVNPKDGVYIRPVGLQTLYDHSGTDPSAWKPVLLVYENQVFKTVDDFIGAYQNKTLIAPRKYQEEDEWSAMKSSGPQRNLEDKPGPRSTTFAGQRYLIDPKQRYIEWMGWQFYIRFNRDTGVALYDVKFKGERIAYEVALTEALAQYSGSNPVQANTVYLDGHFGIGACMFELLDGFDCPQGSSYFDLDYYDTGAKTNNKNVCVFEADSHLPISRHWGDQGDSTYSSFGVNKGYNLVVRGVSTVYNYDYVFDYIFWLDGTFEIKVAASGYMQGTWWTPEDEAKYGGRIHTFAMGSLHDHIINYKIDIDILGTKNSFETTSIESEEISFDWLQEGQKLVQKKMVHTVAEKEFGLEAIPADALGSHWKIINSEKKNSWGNSKGYRIMTANPIRNIIKGNSGSQDNANWSKYYIAVTKRKDEESSSSDVFNQNLPVKPPVNFDAFLNDEGIVQEDIVAWVNLGNHHVPRSEDAPITLTSASRASIIVTPFNYFDEMATRDIRNGAYVTPAEKVTAEATIDTYGVPEGDCYVPYSQQPYKGFPRTYKDV
ncbi:hypothetical protein HDU67_000299 [Dinochytrium kinnereticum]|nr:hypothetical protein HDU67_000299 [Dinochytrium kinnereticum]